MQEQYMLSILKKGDNMFLDTFIENSSECIDLVELELECAVSLEAAYNDAMLEPVSLNTKQW